MDTSFVGYISLDAVNLALKDRREAALLKKETKEAKKKGEDTKVSDTPLSPKEEMIRSLHTFLDISTKKLPSNRFSPDGKKSIFFWDWFVLSIYSPPLSLFSQSFFCRLSTHRCEQYINEVWKMPRFGRPATANHVFRQSPTYAHDGTKLQYYQFSSWTAVCPSF
jgi:hypothetical protein